MIDHNFGQGPVLFTDASNVGYGLVLDKDWQAGHFVDSVPWTDDFWCGSGHSHWCDIVKPLISCADDDINFRELVRIWLTIVRFAPKYRNEHFILYSDNTQAIGMVNTGESVNTSCMRLLREIFWICVFYNIYITARYVPGTMNNIAHALSHSCRSNISSVANCYLLCCNENIQKYNSIL